MLTNSLGSGGEIRRLSDDDARLVDASRVFPTAASVVAAGADLLSKTLSAADDVIMSSGTGGGAVQQCSLWDISLRCGDAGGESFTFYATTTATGSTAAASSRAPTADPSSSSPSRNPPAAVVQSAVLISCVSKTVTVTTTTMGIDHKHDHTAAEVFYYQWTQGKLASSSSSSRRHKTDGIDGQHSHHPQHEGLTIPASHIPLTSKGRGRTARDRQSPTMLVSVAVSGVFWNLPVRRSMFLVGQQPQQLSSAASSTCASTNLVQKSIFVTRRAEKVAVTRALVEFALHRLLSVQRGNQTEVEGGGGGAMRFDLGAGATPVQIDNGSSSSPSSSESEEKEGNEKKTSSRLADVFCAFFPSLHQSQQTTARQIDSFPLPSDLPVGALTVVRHQQQQQQQYRGSPHPASVGFTRNDHLRGDAGGGGSVWTAEVLRCTIGGGGSGGNTTVLGLPPEVQAVLSCSCFSSSFGTRGSGAGSDQQQPFVVLRFSDSDAAPRRRDHHDDDHRQRRQHEKKKSSANHLLQPPPQALLAQVAVAGGGGVPAAASTEPSLPESSALSEVFRAAIRRLNQRSRRSSHPSTIIAAVVTLPHSSSYCSSSIISVAWASELLSGKHKTTTTGMVMEGNGGSGKTDGQTKRKSLRDHGVAPTQQQPQKDKAAATVVATPSAPTADCAITIVGVPPPTTQEEEDVEPHPPSVRVQPQPPASAAVSSFTFAASTSKRLTGCKTATALTHLRKHSFVGHSANPTTAAVASATLVVGAPPVPPRFGLTGDFCVPTVRLQLPTAAATLQQQGGSTSSRGALPASSHFGKKKLQKMRRQGPEEAGGGMVPSRAALLSSQVVGQWSNKFVLLISRSSAATGTTRAGSVSTPTIAATTIAATSSDVAVAECDDGSATAAGGVLICLDQHAAHERVRLEYFIAHAEEYVTASLSASASSSGAAMGAHHQHELVFVPPHLWADVSLASAALRRWGWTFDPSTRAIASFPTVALEGFVYALSSLEVLVSAVDDVLAAGLELSDGVVPMCVVRLLVSRSCRGAVMFGDALSEEHCALLVAGLRHAERYDICSHGRRALCNLTALTPPLAAATTVG